MPDIFIIAGCNGAGKSTAAYNLLPEVFKTICGFLLDGYSVLRLPNFGKKQHRVQEAEHIFVQPI